MDIRRIVVAEDDENDRVLIEWALRSAKLAFPVEFARDGKEVVQILSQAHAAEILLLLDLNMPGMNGFEVMRWLRDAAPENRIATVVMSSSTDAGDIRQASSLGAQVYIVKPTQPAEWVKAFERIHGYWTDALNRDPVVHLAA